ncbi:MAG: hypothetical protein U1D35_12865 [Paracoccaceae bacterium]|nr:hypothetical protein [Paracoccaceae bacterium]
MISSIDLRPFAGLTACVSTCHCSALQIVMQRELISAEALLKSQGLVAA